MAVSTPRVKRNGGERTLGYKSYGLIAEVVNRGGHAGYPEQKHYDHNGQETRYFVEIPRIQWRPLDNL